MLKVYGSKTRPPKDYCIHMRNLIKYALDHKVIWSGCGECGSPWLECEQCKLVVEHAWIME